MAPKFIVVAALFTGAHAFLPQGNLRAQTAPNEILQQPTVPQFAKTPDASLGDNSALAATATISLAAVALALGVAQQRRQAAPRAGHTQCRVAGITFPITEKFDPMNLGNTDAKMERYTAVEIKHGRISMIACIGYAVPEYFHFPGCEKFGDGLAALNTIPAEGWLQLIAVIGAHEVLIKPREGGMGAYDFGYGTDLLTGVDSVEVERRQTVERNNGRLAMIGIMGLMVQDGMFGKTPIAMFKSDGWWGPPVDWFVKDIPICFKMCAVKDQARRTRTATARGAVKDLWRQSTFDAYVPAGSYPTDIDEIIGLKEPRMSKSMPFLKHPIELDGWVGGEKGFDPCGFSGMLPIYWYREMELKHGRVAMLATVGWIATDLGLRFPGAQYQCTTLEAHDKMSDIGVMQLLMALIGVLEVYGGWLWRNGIEGNIQRDAGDFFIGKQFLPKDEAKANEMRLKELENGRLAMLAFSGIVTQAQLTGAKWPFF